MAGYINTTRGGFVLPGSVEANPGVEIDITKDMLENASVKEWIKGGQLVPAKDYKAPVSVGDVAEMRAQIEILTAERDAVIGQRDAALADLAEATKPKKA